jgi:magnesium transporter
MMTIYGLRQGRPVRLERTGSDLPPPADVIWIDLHDPTRDEECAVEAMLGLEIPTRQEMAEIEESSRLYEEGGALIMTAVVVHGAAEGRPTRAPVTFVLTPKHLVSVRYADLSSFRAFQSKLQRSPERCTSADRIFASLVDTIVERAADVLEMVAADLNEVSTRLFIEDPSTTTAAARLRRKAGQVEDELQATIKRIGRKNLTMAILRESLLSLSRLVPFVRQGASEWLTNGGPARLKQLERDVRSLSAYEMQLSSEITFLHEATIGLINLGQNRIIKVFSIASVLFLPPTLVGTIYGMNFERMPELKWASGYPFAILLMILSAVVPYFWFKQKGWL